ncbi:MAG: FAD-dependent thymidylate synthase [Candidatus Micrarchaeota archaeon]
MKVVLLRHTPEPDKACATAARQCYSAVGVQELTERMTDEQVTKLLADVVKSGHHSVLEHAYFTFGVEGISRACSHQLVRHRVASYSQQSQRYVKENDFDYVVPPLIRGNPEALSVFCKSMADAQNAYNSLKEAGIKSEDARFVLPNACETKIVITMNARELLHFFEKRLCIRAQWEIRAMAQAMLDECVKVSPTIFKLAGATCDTQGICWEGARSCSKWKSIEGAELRERRG